MAVTAFGVYESCFTVDTPPDTAAQDQQTLSDVGGGFLDLLKSPINLLQGELKQIIGGAPAIGCPPTEPCQGAVAAGQQLVNEGRSQTQHAMFNLALLLVGGIEGGIEKTLAKAALRDTVTDTVDQGVKNGLTSIVDRPGTEIPATSGVDPAANRVYLRQATRQAIQDAAPRTAEGDFIDPNTGQVIPQEGPFDYGHQPGYEWWRTQEIARTEGWSRQDVIEYENDPTHYQIEDPSSNRSHLYEMP